MGPLAEPRRRRALLLWLLPLVAVGLLLAGGGHALHAGEASHGALPHGPDGVWSAADAGDCALCGVTVAELGDGEPPRIAQRALERARPQAPEVPPAREASGLHRARAPPVAG